MEKVVGEKMNEAGEGEKAKGFENYTGQKIIN